MKRLLLVLAVSGLISGCSRSPTGPDVTLTPQNYQVIEESAVPKFQGILEIPTYDGSGQAVHPDIIYLREGFRGFHFFMVVTPYPYGDNQVENPCLLASNDGVSFVEPIFGMNPLAPTPPGGRCCHNCDPDILFNYETEEFWIYYLEVINPDYYALKLLRSCDLENWRLSELIRWDLSNDDCVVSPCVFKIDGGYVLIYADGRGHCNIRYLESPDGLHWEKRDAIELNIPWPDGFQPWHCDLVSDGTQFYLLANGWRNCKPFERQNLYLARSWNLIDWTVLPEPIIHSSEEKPLIYRSTGLIAPGKLIVYFSQRTAQGEWQIGCKNISLNTQETILSLKRIECPIALKIIG
jgi:hypothetical protein